MGSLLGSIFEEPEPYNRLSDIGFGFGFSDKSIYCSRITIIVIIIIILCGHNHHAGVSPRMAPLTKPYADATPASN